MEELVKYLLHSILTEPDQVEVTINQTSADQTEVTLHAPSAIMGQIIGKQGKTVNSLRQILRLWGHLHEQRVNLQIEEK